VIVVTGLWMWKGHVLRRLISSLAGSQSSTIQTARD
jgi:hypothetical protein